MNLLLDTHILIWALNDDSRLPSKAKDMILNGDNTIYYSCVSVWEVSIKHSSHPDNVEFTGKELSHYCREAGYNPLIIRDEHVFALETLGTADNAPPHHDPFDRLLIAQAKTENLTFVTHDSLLSNYNERCVMIV